MYKQLRAIDRAQSYICNPYDSYDRHYKAFSKLKNNRLRTAMLEALEGCSNWGSDIGFEISPRNVAVNNGKLVLLDVFFSKSKLKEIRSN